MARAVAIVCTRVARTQANSQSVSALPGIRSCREAIRESRIAIFANKLVWAR
jgi:hypothetical protein